MAIKLKNLLSAMNQNRPGLGLMVGPSWLSGLVCAVLSIAVVAVAAFSVQYKGSDLQLLRESEIKQTQTVNDNFESVDNSLGNSELVSDTPLFILWGGVGLVAYALTMNIAGTFKKAVDFEQQLGYVHVDRRQLIRRSVLRATLRVVFFAELVFFIGSSRGTFCCPMWWRWRMPALARLLAGRRRAICY